LDRLRIAIKNKENFKLFVVLPIQVAAPIRDVTPRFLTFWNYATISRGKFSLFRILSEEFPNEDINNYVHFGSLRTYDFFKSGNPVTEMIYVHSKLMIVDDRIVIIGSANINDRSLVGNRDSELGVIIEDTNSEIIKMGGNDFTVSKFGHSLRMDLWRYHLGLNKDKSEDHKIKDPIEFFQQWKKIANENTKHFSDVFPNLHDKVFRERELKRLTNYGKTKIENIDKLKLIKGHLVNFPMDFLKDSNIYSSIIDALDILLV
jgi:phospholipase D1/2